MDAAKLHKNAAGAGELVLQNGRQAGARRALAMPATFIGRGQACDIRLNVDGVDSMHCVLVLTPEGVHLRDLNSAHGTIVNGTRSEQLLLQHGDNIKVGPFQFRFEATPAVQSAQPADTSAEATRESVSIQAAAVAAQQIALEEEESRLQKRKSDLEQQEEQLAAHLAEKQQQVQLWSDFTKAERDTLRKEKLEQEKKIAQIEADLLRARDELAQDHQKLGLERQHITKVYQRLRQRWQRQWSAEKEKYQKQADELLAERQLLEHWQAVQREREAGLAQEILRFNTERELSSRLLQDGRDTLRKDQEAWRSRRSIELAALNARRQELDESQIKITRARQLLVQAKLSWDHQEKALQKELHGLNNRIVHQRLRVQELQEQINQLEEQRRDRVQGAAMTIEDVPQAIPNPTETETLVPAQPERDRRCADLDRLAGELADQRALLVEQYQRLVEVQAAWHEERDRAAAELEALAHRLLEDELALGDRQQQATVVEELLRDRQTEMDRVRQEILSAHAQLKAREQSMAEEHEKEMSSLRQKETLLEEQLAGLDQLRQRWNRRRQQEIEQLQGDRELLGRDQRETHAERVLLFEKTQQLAEEKRILAEKSLALEEYCQEVFVRAKDPASQRRVERLRRRWLTLNAAVVAGAKRETESARNDLARLEECRTSLLEEFKRLTRDEDTLTERQTVLDKREADLKTRQLRLDEGLQKLEIQRGQSASHLLRLNDEVENLAKAVFDETDLPNIDQAA